MARRKVVFVIVEGPSDDTALGIALSQVYDKDSVYIHIMHGDITTRRGGNSQNIISRIWKEVQGYANSNHYKATDFKQIIHIVDMDGVYIPDDHVIEQKTAANVRYASEGIYTSDVDGIIARNKVKSDILYKLRTCGNIRKIPYRVYYMSCNLDHVLYDKRNSTDEAKENDAYAFAKKYKGNMDGFVKFICESEFSVNGDFKESWRYIETGMNSIERYTNLCIGIRDELDLRAGMEI